MEVPAHAGQVDHDVNVGLLEERRLRDAAPLQDLRRVDRARRDHDLQAGLHRLHLGLLALLHVHGLELNRRRLVGAVLEEQAGHFVADEQVVVGAVVDDLGVVAQA